MQDSCGDAAFSMSNSQPLESQDMQPLRRVEIKEIEDVDSPCSRARFTEAYPGQVGKTLGHSETQFERWHQEQENQGESTWVPFEDQAEWDLACWLIRNVGQKSIDEYLKLPIVSSDSLVFRTQTKSCLKIQQHAQLSFHNTYSFLKKIDKLPSGPEWTCDVVDVTGDWEGEDSMPMREELELWCYELD